ncbi:MAG TPA: HDOD domain-containing protein [Syntrophobacteraceae bacterium]|nr:HDOD domain-containing protein [Syntrophobacteraceae bacterium]
METGGKILSLSDTVERHASLTQLKLPVFPGAAFELRQLLASDDASIDQISQVISKDQAIATNVLKLANSTFYSGTNRSVRTVRDAVMCLGSNHILNLVICSCQHTYYKSQNKMLSKYLEILWQHALCVSIGSKWLLHELGYRKFEDEGFLAGLLHDIGKLVIIKTVEAIYSADINIDLRHPNISITIESMHAQQGYKLLDAWSIPVVYSNISLNHHSPDFDASDILSIAVRISNQVCRKMGISTNSERPADVAASPEIKALAIDEYVLADLETVILDAVQSEYSMLNELGLDNSTPYGIYL